MAFSGKGDKRKRTTSSGKNSKKSKSSDNVYNKGFLLCELTKQAGVILMDGQVHNSLAVSRTIFQKQLSLALKHHSGDLFQNVELFLDEFDEYLEDSKRFHESLMPCELSNAVNLQNSVPDSVIRLFLGVDVIQSPLMNRLLDKLLEFVGSDDDFMFCQGQKVYIPRLMLSQFRFLDRIVDGKELTKKLLEVLGDVSLDVQKEVMACLPDIVEDSEHGEVAIKLRDELMNNKDLTCSVIDALTFLNISPDLVSEVRNSVLGMLKSFSIADHAIVVGFLLDFVNSRDALEVVNEIRTGIEFSTSTKLSPNEMEKVKSNVKLTMEAIKGKMQCHRPAAEAWLKTVDQAKDSKVLDLFILLILHWMGQRKAVESLLRNKVRAGLITEARLEKAFEAYTHILRDYFSSILSLAQILLRSPEPSICTTGSSLYKLGFASFDVYCKQEIVGSLVTHIGSGCANEIEASLDTLSHLVKHQLQAMTQYAVFVKGVLDYLDHNNLSVTQIKKLYLLLAQLAFHSSQDRGYLQDDLHIIIRKQLTSGNAKYIRMGIMGALSVLVALSSRPCSDAEVVPNANSSSSEDNEQVIGLLELIKTSVQTDPDMAAMFMDSLAVVMARHKLDKKVAAWISETTTEAFETNYIVDLSCINERDKTRLAVEGQFNLNNVEESTIVINLVPLVEIMYDKGNQKKISCNTSPVCLAPHFHLLTSCEQSISDGSLESVDALLGCPLFMFKSEIYERLQTLSGKEKDVVCSSLFLCINWFREVINSFASSTDPEMKGKVLMRLKHITELMEKLEICLKAHPHFLPQAAVFDSDNSSTTAATTTSKLPGMGGTGKKGRKGKGTGKKSKKGKENTEVSMDTQSQNEDSHSQSQLVSGKSQDDNTEMKKEEIPISWGSYGLHFRELDMSVFTILQTALITRAEVDTNMNSNNSEELRLGFPQLKFLLEDLSLKLNHVLVASASKRRTFFKTKGDKHVGFSILEQLAPEEVAQKAVQLLPCLCNHLEEACTFFQEQMDQNDGLIDGPGRFLPEATMMSSCYQLLLQCIVSLMSWNGFGLEGNKDLEKEALMTMVKRLRTSQDESNFVSLKEALKYAFQYFGNLVDTVPNLETAVTLVKLLTTLTEKLNSKTTRSKLASHAKAFLTQDWRGSDGERLKGAKHNENLQILLRTYISFSKDPLVELELIATQGMVELINLDKNGCSEEFSSLNSYYKVVLCELIQNAKRIPPWKRSDSEDEKEEKLMTWSMAVKVLQVIVSLSKIFTARSNLGVALKYGRQFMELFLRLGMPLLDVTFRKYHEPVQKLLRSLQQSTRILHHLCSHSKILKDVALINQVPMLKRALESFVYRVRAMLTLNNCQDAFWIGNLKNRNLQGEEIKSQASLPSSAVTADSDNEDNSDDNENEEADEDKNEDSEVEMEAEADDNGLVDSNANTGSYSEVF